MNLTDLHDVLSERSTQAGERSAHQIRMAGVQGKARAIRRRRAAGGVVAGLAVLLGGTVVAPDLLDTIASRQRESVAARRDSNGFLEYQYGRKLIESAVGAPSQRSLTMGLPLTSPDLAFVPRCTFAGGDDRAHLWWELTANGHDLGGGSCSSDTGSMVSWGPVGDDPMKVWSDLGINAGDNVTFEMTITRYELWNTATDSGELLPIPRNLTISFGVYQRVPFEEYPFPARPDRLTPLDESITPAGDEVLRIESAVDPMQRRAAEVTLTEKLTVAGVAQTPGRLEIRVDGTLVYVHESWTYELGVSQSSLLMEILREKGVPVRAGQRVIVDVQPFNVTGAWRVVVGEQPDADTVE